jgi:hypothetical protein
MAGYNGSAGSLAKLAVLAGYVLSIDGYDGWM